MCRTSYTTTNPVDTEYSTATDYVTNVETESQTSTTTQLATTTVTTTQESPVIVTEYAVQTVTVRAQPKAYEVIYTNGVRFASTVYNVGVCEHCTSFL